MNSALERPYKTRDTTRKAISETRQIPAHINLCRDPPNPKTVGSLSAGLPARFPPFAPGELVVILPATLNKIAEEES